MKVLSKSDDSATVVLSMDELRLLSAVLTEITSGPEALDDRDWDMLIGWPRSDALALGETVHGLLPSRLAGE